MKMTYPLKYPSPNDMALHITKEVLRVINELNIPPEYITPLLDAIIAGKETAVISHDLFLQKIEENVAALREDV